MASVLFLLGCVWLFIVGWLFYRQQRAWGRGRASSVSGSPSGTVSGTVSGSVSGSVLGKKDGGLAGDVLAGGLLFLGVLGFFWRTLSGDVFQPADGGDLVSFLFPTYRFAATQLAYGALPLWNPHLYGGAPFISDIQAGFLYLPNLLLFLGWPDFPYTALQWLSTLHIYWAGLGMYVLLRTLTWHNRSTPIGARKPVNLPYVLNRPAAFIGALAFQYSDPLLTHLGNLNLIAVLSWMPWVLAAYSRAMVGQDDTPPPWRVRLRWIGVAGLLFALANYAGHAQSSLYIGLALVLYTLGNSIPARRRSTKSIHSSPSPSQSPSQSRARARLERVGLGRTFDNGLALLATGTLTLLLTAPILLPAIEMSGYTARSEYTYQETIDFSMAPTQAIGLVTPGFFGRGPALHWSLWDRIETPYAGVAPLMLAIGGLLMAPIHNRRRLLIWATVGLFGFITALGVYALFHGWLTWAIPPFGQLRAPARALVLWTLAVGVLAAYGVDTLMRRASIPGTMGPYLRFLRNSTWTWAGLILPITFATLLLTLHDENAFLRASVAALALTLAAALWAATWLLLGTYRAGWFGPRLLGGLVALLVFMDFAASGAYTDISSEDPTRGFDHPQVIDFLRNDPDFFRIDTRTGMDHLWQPDTAALYGLQDVDGIVNPLMLRHWRDFWESTGGRHTRQYDMLNVKYVLVEGDTPLPESKFERRLEGPRGLNVYENLHFQPRAWVVSGVEIVPDPETARARFAAGEVDLSTHVLLVAEDGGAHLPAEPMQPDSTAGTAEIVHYGSSEMTLQISASRAAYLVLSEVWYPGWHATVNGQPAPVLRANFAQRAVPLPPGESTVRLWFHPPTWTGGLALGGGGLVLALILVVPLARRRPRTGSAQTEAGDAT